MTARLRGRIERADDSGYTVPELVVASAIMLFALAMFFGSISSLHRTSSYQKGRTIALDDMRITAGAFAKDARHARAITLATPTKVEMETYVKGSLKTVTYEVVAAEDNLRDLERRESGGPPRRFVVRLTDSSIFKYDIEQALLDNDPQLAESVRRVEIVMQNRPSPSYPPIRLETEVSLRNVSA